MLVDMCNTCNGLQLLVVLLPGTGVAIAILKKHNNMLIEIEGDDLLWLGVPVCACWQGKGVKTALHVCDSKLDIFLLEIGGTCPATMALQRSVVQCSSC